jgi:hypothetical protein
MDEELFNDFLIGKWKWIVYVIKAYYFMIYILYMGWRPLLYLVEKSKLNIWVNFLAYR